ncbi:MAG TPA: hypothetical protein VN814_05120 [Caulobacteraceae bacterium]|nr:hypothetical protein [Caulobacteraceae bacterium]
MRDNRAFKGTLVGVSALALAALMLPAGGAIAVVNKTTTRSNTQHNVHFNPALGHGGVGKRRHGRSLVIEKDQDSTSTTFFHTAAAGSITHRHKITVHANTGVK